ncbi:MAG TPA: LD-carboxypeptidase [Lysinibacillus sp.]|jgi:muramoyltetrapeptide carboxypeptidase|uniref:S66 family peptidase n=1 Tax=unclassified Lysinibacillus TaxID=2636778 RepID=UPI0007385827|nr:MULTISPECIES: S66 peptidase family protein [unclassified Lysinibacillus]HBT71446.1 LD-carboxypeptidase [Lysinibacillus sp.]KUF36279.1 peptidase S66 [Lysinibacillus sp. F5]WCH48581.1 LD-carboxypeptidase [Lysinibacillus sp. OF-1]SCX77591.1 microcin C7 immunity protein. Serine peptidase. MEROPS family S66 [Lysinibacillus sp. SG9]SDB02528.1 microcin C7 immunity protein. Serine peptidase. MEROPS family S66 [Lysinibacillus sp. TC-37]
MTTQINIGIYSPSSPATVTALKRYERAKLFLEEKNFQIVTGSLTGKSDYYRSGSPKERAEELNELLRNPDVDIIMSTIGGTNANSMLPYIDYEAFRQQPKIVVGYSDATAILLALYAKTGIATFYGPAFVPSFGEFEPLVNDTFKFFEDYFFKPQALPYEMPMPSYWSDEPVNWLEKTVDKKLKKNEWLTIQEGVVEGRLIGGNVNAMYGFIGTPYFPEILEGDILLVEDCLKNAAIVEKNFAMLKLHGVFNKVRGIILGKHECYDDLGTGRQPYDILLEQLDGIEIPLLAEVDICHTHPMHPIAIGKRVKLDATAKKIYCVEKWL